MGVSSLESNLKPTSASSEGRSCIGEVAKENATSLNGALLWSCHLQVATLLTQMHRLPVLSIHQVANFLVWYLDCCAMTRTEASRGISVTKDDNMGTVFGATSGTRVFGPT